MAVAVVGVLLVCRYTLPPWLRWRTTHYVFTTHRILIRSGVFSHTGRVISLRRINDVGFHQSLRDRMVRAGTLTIESAGENGQQHLRDIPRSNQQQQTINRLIEQDGNAGPGRRTASIRRLPVRRERPAHPGVPAAVTGMPAAAPGRQDAP